MYAASQVTNSRGTCLMPPAPRVVFELVADAPREGENFTGWMSNSAGVFEDAVASMRSFTMPANHGRVTSTTIQAYNDVVDS